MAVIGRGSERQPAMYFPLGGGNIERVSKARENRLSRIFVESASEGRLGACNGRDLPREEIDRRLGINHHQWPIIKQCLHGVSRIQLMARHKSNHIQVAYGNDAVSAILQ